MQQVADHDRLEDIELKVALGAGKGRGNVVTKDLSADHSQRLALCWIDLSRHDGRTRLVLWELELAETASRTRAEEADILCDLEEGRGEGVELTMGLDNGVVGSESLELVGCGDELMAGHLADLSRDVLSKALESVNSSSDSSSTLSKHLQARQRSLYALNAKVKLLYVARKLLAKGQRCGVLQMCPANLDEVLPLLALLLQGVA